MNTANGLGLWIAIGTLAGWLASESPKTSPRQGPYRDVALGIAGALLGGYLTQALLGISGGRSGLFASLGVALLGACVLLEIPRLLFSPSPRRRRARRC